MANEKPTFHFFVDYVNLPNSVAANLPSDAFGPVSTNPTNQYRTTSFVRAGSLTKVLAICDGEIMIQPQTEDATKVNLILKPAASAVFSPIKIKYFIYRGVNKSDLINNDVLEAVNSSDPNQPFFLQKLWKEFVDFNMPFYNQGIIDTPPDTFPTFLIGYDESQSGDTLIENYFRRNSDDEMVFYQIPACKRGEHIGNFTGRIGLDVVLDYGDYELTNQDELFKLDLNFARKEEHIFNLADIQSSTPTNVKRYKEYIHQFLDAAAFWGAQIDSGIIMPGSLTSSANIFTNILNKYQTKNKLYFYIQAERSRSYNYYDSNRKVHGIDTTPISNDTNGWPIIIKEKTFSSSNHSLKIGLEYFIDPNIHPLNRSVSISVLASNHDLSIYPIVNKPDFKIEKIIIDTKETEQRCPIVLGYIGKQFEYDVSLLYDLDRGYTSFALATNANLPAGLSLNNAGKIDGIPTTHETRTVEIHALTAPNTGARKFFHFMINPVIETAPIIFAFNGTISCANYIFLFGDIKQETSPVEYFNDLWLINVRSPLNLPNEDDLVHWINYNKNRVKNLDDILSVSGIVEQKIVFDNGFNNNVVIPLPSTKKRRTYITGVKKSSNNTDYNISSFTAGFERKITDGTLYANKLFNDNDFIFYKGKFEDGSPTNTFSSLALFNNSDYRKKYNYLLLGITEEEFNKLIYDNPSVPSGPNPIQLLPLDADNVFFYLEEVTGFTAPNVKKFKLGLQYEDNTGVLQVVFPSLANEVYIYTIDGYFFCTPEYADYQPFFRNYPKSIAKFRIYQPYDGEYGFDWMRIGDTNAQGDVAYKNNVGKLYYPSVTPKRIVIDINRDTGDFQIIDDLYNKLEIEYASIPFQPNILNNIEKYFVPKLSIYPPYNPIPAPGIDLDRQPIIANIHNDDQNRVANLELVLNVQSSSSRIDLEYNQSNLQIQHTIQNMSGSYHIEVRALQEYGTEEVIKVVAYDNSGKKDIIGLLSILPNTSVYRKMKKVLLVSVATNINGTDQIPVVSDSALTIMKFLRQAFVSPFFDVFDFDRRNDTTLNSDFVRIYQNQNAFITNNNQNLFLGEYLYDQLKQVIIPGSSIKIGEKYKDYVRVFFLDQVGITTNSSGGFVGLRGIELNGNVLLFNSAQDATPTHEILHALNLPHSFVAYEADNYAKFTYQPDVTNNMMDYTSNVRISLWDWQGKIINKESNPEP